MNSLPRSRGGHTLIEMMATLTVLLVLGMAAAKLLTVITQIGFLASNRKTSIAMIERLSDDFRNDIANSESMSIGDKADSIELISGKTTIRYEFNGQTDSIHRTENNSDIGKESSRQGSTEQYRLTDRCQPKFTSDNDLVVLRLTIQGQPNPWTIEAAKP